MRFVKLAVLMMLTASLDVAAQAASLAGLNVDVTDTESGVEVSSALQILALLTVLSLAPAILIVVTAFTRIIIVLSMLRYAFGMQSTPPNTVIVSLALFLTLFTMMPVIERMNTEAYAPSLTGRSIPGKRPSGP